MRRVGGCKAGGKTGAGGYRYGFNGKENDNEVKGEGYQQDYGMRVYDPMIAKFLSVDPLTPEYPELTPYQFASNRPIDGIDRDGLEYTPAGNNTGGQPRDNTAVRKYDNNPVIMDYDVATAPFRRLYAAAQKMLARVSQATVRSSGGQSSLRKATRERKD